MKHSAFRHLIEYLLIAFCAYLVFSAIIAIIGGYNYRSILTSENQLWACVFVYWWIPLPRMFDMGEHDENYHR